MSPFQFYLKSLHIKKALKQQHLSTAAFNDHCSPISDILFSVIEFHCKRLNIPPRSSIGLYTLPFA